MAKFCPDVKRRVVYLDCLECDEKICRGENKENSPTSSSFVDESKQSLEDEEFEK